ncbi:MAG: hypothetical protein SFY56_11190 [Bacteroidota bacterium]|nr:hypothetical protein [Bacteroidota bacterium]
MRLLEFKNQNYTSENKYISFTNIWDDFDYMKFIKDGHTGFYFNKSLHIYGISADNFHDIIFINQLFKSNYNFAINENVKCFASDLFGNQFCWNGYEIIFFNNETCEMEPLAKNFREWVNVILEDINYFTGNSILNLWEEIMLPLEFSEKLVPIKPFVLGGEYHPNNLRPLNFIESIKYNSEIAKQIFDLPDGTEIKIEIK